MMRDQNEKPKLAKAGKPAAAMTREDRLKAALKANMARRKAQAKARAHQDDAAVDNKGE